ncbi:MAG: response regulator transcription factor [Deltaproteobacteria bacterium]|nr:response regulator transcription factor [Deltaproteobacteria bacterium]
MTRPCNNRKIRVLIADDLQIIREGLSSMLKGSPDIEVVGVAEDGMDAVGKARMLDPDVILMDIIMPRMEGPEAARIIKRENPDVGILVVTMYDREDYIFEMVRAGAAGYLLKNVGSEEVINAVRVVARGESMIHPAVARKILNEFSHLSSKEAKGRKIRTAEGLSARELTVLKSIAEGKSNKEIANTLDLSEKTVKNHVRNIFKKLNVFDRTQAAIYAFKKGLIEPGVK